MSGLSWAKMAKAESRSHRHLVREASSGTVRQPRQDQAPGGEAEAEALLEGGERGGRDGAAERGERESGRQGGRGAGTAPPAAPIPPTPPADLRLHPGPGAGPSPRPPPRCDPSITPLELKWSPAAPGLPGFTIAIHISLSL